MRSAFTLIVLLGLLILAGAIGFWTWQEVGEVEIGMHGWIAIGLGAAVTFLLGAGLMALMFLSSRRGYDERAHHSEKLPGDPWRPSGGDEE